MARGKTREGRGGPGAAPASLTGLLGGLVLDVPRLWGWAGKGSLPSSTQPSSDRCCPFPPAGSTARGQLGRGVYRRNHPEPGRDLLRPLLRPHRLPVGDRARHARQPGHHLRRGEGLWGSFRRHLWGPGRTGHEPPLPGELPLPLTLCPPVFCDPRLKDREERRVKRESPPSSSR